MYWGIIKNKNIIFYLLGAAASHLGNVISGLAFMFLAYEMTKSSVYTTVVVISQVAPYLFFGLIGGVIADWVNKKKLLIIIDLIKIPLTLLPVLINQLQLLSYWHLVIVSFLIHSLSCFFNPAHRAILPIITRETERSSVNSLFDTVTRGITVLGPIVSVVLINTINVIHFFTFDALTYLLSAILIYRIQLPDTKLINGNLSQWKLSDIFVSIKHFLIWVNKQATIRTLFIVTVIMVFFNTWVWQVGLLLQLIATTPKGEEWYSIFLGCYGATVIMVNLFIPFIWKKLSLKTYLYGSLIWGIGILMLGFSYAFPLYFIGVFAAGMGLPISSLSRVYLLQTYLPTKELGKGFSFNAFLLYLSNAISLGVFGVLSSFLPTRILFIICGFMMVFCAAIYLRIRARKVLGVMPYNRLNN